MNTNPFSPATVVSSAGEAVLAPTQVSAGTSATSFTLPSATGFPCIRIENQTNAWAFVLFNNQGATASTSNCQGFAPGSVEVMQISSKITGGSVILSTGTGTVAFSRGIGV